MQRVFFEVPHQGPRCDEAGARGEAAEREQPVAHDDHRRRAGETRRQRVVAELEDTDVPSKIRGQPFDKQSTKHIVTALRDDEDVRRHRRNDRSSRPPTRLASHHAFRDSGALECANSV